MSSYIRSLFQFFEPIPLNLELYSANIPPEKSRSYLTLCENGGLPFYKIVWYSYSDGAWSTQYNILAWAELPINIGDEYE